jgi:hypothetical protein
LGEIIKRWSSLSLFSLPGEIGNHIQSLSLSLSLTKRARFGKPDLPLEYSAGHKKREGWSSLRKKINSRAKAGKKRWIGFLLIAAREQQPQRVVASKTKTHIYPRTNLCYLPSAPAGHASKIHSSSVALIYMCVYILLDLFDKRVRTICALLCSNTHEDEMWRLKKLSKSFHLDSFKATTPHE